MNWSVPPKYLISRLTKKIALTLSTSLDEPVFGDAERGPDEALKLKFTFKALRQFDADERKIAEGVLDSLINNHQANWLFARSLPLAVPAAATPVRKRDAGNKRAANR